MAKAGGVMDFCRYDSLNGQKEVVKMESHRGRISHVGLAKGNDWV